MHDTKMSQAEMDSTRKVAPGSVEKSLVVTIITLLEYLPCLMYFKKFKRLTAVSKESDVDIVARCNKPKTVSECT